MLPEGITRIEQAAFSNCNNLIDINVPGTVTEIGDRAFFSCYKLPKIDLPDSVTNIGTEAFYYCTGLKSVRLPKGLTKISVGSFRNCSSLSEIDIPNNVVSIQGKAFYGCTTIGSGLKNIALPASINSIDTDAFYETSLENVYYAGSQESFKKIAISSGNDTLRNANITYAVSISSIGIVEQDISLNIGDIIQLSVKLEPDNADNKSILWGVDQPEIVSVDGYGVITALSGGSAVVYAKTIDGIVSSSCKVTVYVPLTGFRITQDRVLVKLKEATKLPAEYNPSNASNKNTVWTLGNSELAEIDREGDITGIRLGETTLKGVTEEGGYTDECSIKVVFKNVANESEFFFDYVYDMVERGVVGGYDDGTFRPYGNCNRAAVVTFLWRLNGKPEPEKMASFSDLTGNSDFDKAISWASENGITTGWADNTFRPWNTCNRAAVMTFLWRTVGKPEPEKIASFSDLTENTDFDKAISWASENGITTGWADNTFRPWNTCNRLAVVSFLARYDALTE